MYGLKKYLKFAGLMIGLFAVIVLLTFVKTWMNDRQNGKISNVGLSEESTAAQYVFSGFVESSGFKTDYLKVHLKVPEGDSFALTRADYEAWAASGGDEEALFDQYIYNTFEQETDIKPETVPFEAQGLQRHLADTLQGEINFTVEGEEKVDANINIYMDQVKENIDAAQLEDLTVKLISQIFRIYDHNTNQRVNAFKLIDKNNDTLFVVYRNEVDILWPEGTSEDRVRSYITKGWKGDL